MLNPLQYRDKARNRRDITSYESSKWYFLYCISNNPLVSQHFHFQNKLTSQVTHNGLHADDRLNLGVVKVWGAGSVQITHATLTPEGGTAHELTPTHNLDTQVSFWIFISQDVFMNMYVCLKLQVTINILQVGLILTKHLLGGWNYFPPQPVLNVRLLKVPVLTLTGSDCYSKCWCTLPKDPYRYRPVFGE